MGQVVAVVRLAAAGLLIWLRDQVLSLLLGASSAIERHRNRGLDRSDDARQFH